MDDVLASSPHRYPVGGRVKFTSTIERIASREAEYEITRLMPLTGFAGGERPQYLLRRLDNGQARVAREDQIAPA